MTGLKKIALLFGPTLYGIVLLVAVWANYSAPRLTANFEWKEQTWVAVADSGSVQEGDRLNALGGLNANRHSLLVDNAFVASRKEFWDWLDTKSELYDRLSGSSVSLELERAGSVLSIEVPVSRNTWSFLSEPSLIHFPVSLTFLLVGWATFQQAGSNKQAKWFYVLCLSMSLVYLSNVCSLLANPVLQPTVFLAINLLNILNFVLGPALLLHFSLLMPTDRAKFWILGLIYVPAFWSVITLNIPWHGILVPTFFLSALVAIAQGAFAYRGLIERQQMKWVGVGFLLGLGPWILFNGIPLVLTGQRLISDTLPGACLIFIPVFMGVAVQRYRLFDISSFLENTFVYLSTIALLVGVDLLLLNLTGLGTSLGEWQILSFALVLGLYGPVRAKLATLISQLGHRSRVSDREAIQILITELEKAELAQIPAALRATVQTLYAPTDFEEVEPDNRELGAHLEVNEPPTVLLVVAPHLALRCGPLPEGRFYTSRDVELLETLALHCSVTYQAAHNYHTAVEERNQRLQEKEQLLGDLHDGVGSALANIKMTSQETKTTRLASDALFELQNFLYTGPEYVKAYEEFVSELKSYGAVFFQDHPMSFEFEAKGDLKDTLIRSKALSIFRIFKEALTNALKHSQAKVVEVCIEADRDLLLTVSDDGRGLEGKAKGRGLTSIERRVEALGGTLEFHQNEGTRLSIRIPI